MTRSDEAEWWFNAVYEAVQQIPFGKVTTYGHIARLLDQPQRARQVGICLKHLPVNAPGVEHFYHDKNVPWQRVINAKGTISHRGLGQASRQAAALRDEGVMVCEDPMGEYTVDMAATGWFPRRLSTAPSDSDETLDSELDGET